MIVVDTNIICYLFISSDRSEQAEKLLMSDSDWHAPILWRSEIRSVLSRYLRKKILAMNDVLQIIQHADDLLKNNEYEVQSSSVMHLVDSSTCSAYDCEFIALAQHLSAPLITADEKVLREFPDIAISLNDYLS